MTAYVGATLWDGSGGPPQHDAAILVDRSGHIARLGPAAAVTVPRGAAVMPLDGRWIIPGLVDAHASVARWMLSRFLAYGVTAVRGVGGAPGPRCGCAR